MRCDGELTDLVSQLLLLLWKSILACIGGMKDISRVKEFVREVEGLPPDEKGKRPEHRSSRFLSVSALRFANAPSSFHQDLTQRRHHQTSNLSATKSPPSTLPTLHRQSLSHPTWIASLPPLLPRQFVPPSPTTSTPTTTPPQSKTVVFHLAHLLHFNSPQHPLRLLPPLPLQNPRSNSSKPIKQNLLSYLSLLRMLDPKGNLVRCLTASRKLGTCIDET